MTLDKFLGWLWSIVVGIVMLMAAVYVIHWWFIQFFGDWLK